MPIQKRLLCGALCVGMLLQHAVAADALLKPLPTVDTAKLAPAAAASIKAAHDELDRARSQLIGPPLAQLYANLAAAYAHAGLKDAAAVALYDAAQIDPADSRWLYLRGVIARDMKQNAEARADFEAALKLDEAYLPIRYRLSDTLVDLGDIDGARKVLERTTREHADQAVAFAMLAQISVRQKRYADAIENLQTALKLEPQATQLYSALAEAYTGAGNTAAAKDAEAKAGDVLPQLVDPLVAGLYGGGATAQPAGTPLQQAEQLASSGRVEAARAKLADFQRDHPNDVDALAFQARFEAALGNQPVAQAAADQALKLKSDNAAALLARGVVYEYAGDENQAYAYYQRAVRADPKLASGRLLLGDAEMRRTHYGPAAEQYRQLTLLQPGDAHAQARLVAAEVAAGQCARALADTSAAQSRNPKDGELMQIFVRLASTCAAAKKEERDMALDYAQALYKQRPDAGDSSALALALAAHGKFKEAQEYQAEAIFEAVRGGDKQAAELFKATQASFVASQVPDRPWPAGHAYFNPPLLTPVKPVAPAPPPPARK
ncbi:MAG TPA: tetratricopeptide repeat protein [Rudaea sp.]|nr:tetratricopeptide repeat protein [Rudaea sp.]